MKKIAPTMETDEITRARFEKYAVAVIENSDVGAAVKQLGISRSTLLRAMKNPAFQVVFREVRGQVISAALASLSAIAGKAVRTLEAVLDSDCPAYAKAGAAGKILDLILKIRETDDLEGRLEAVEQLLKDRDVFEGQAQP